MSEPLIFPPEWARHTATWMSWPFDDDMWFGHLKEVRLEYQALVEAIASVEHVHLVVRDHEAKQSALGQLGQRQGITLHERPLDDVWMRDNGPIFIRQGSKLALTNWLFNAWGEKYDWQKDNLIPAYVAEYLKLPRVDINCVMEGGSLEINSQGLLITTEQCLLTPTRNPNMTKRDIEATLGQHLGVKETIWLKQGLEGDHTDGHIDTITRFVSDDVVLTSVCGDKNDINYLTMAENLHTLRSYRGKDGNKLQIVELPLPAERLYLEDGTRLPPTYANFYIANGLVVVPQYGDIMDKKALGIITEVFPDRKVVGLKSRAIINGGGSFHCLTQQQPEV